MQMTQLVTILALCASTVHAADPIAANKVTVDLANDRLATLLHVNQIEVEVVAEEPFTSASVQLDFYRNGEKVDSMRSASTSNVNPQTTAKISLQTADLDFLQLADGKPGNIRFLVELTTSGKGPPMHTGRTLDIAKSVCSVVQVSGASGFSKGTIHDGVLPLCWMLHDNATGASRVTSGTDPKELVESNPTADIVVVSLKLINETPNQKAVTTSP